VSLITNTPPRVSSPNNSVLRSTLTVRAHDANVRFTEIDLFVRIRSEWRLFAHTYIYYVHAEGLQLIELPFYAPTENGG